MTDPDLAAVIASRDALAEQVEAVRAIQPLPEDKPDGIELAYEQGFNNALYLVQEAMK